MFEVFYGARVQFKSPVPTGPKSSATTVGCCAAAFSGFTTLDHTILTIGMDSLAIPSAPNVRSVRRSDSSRPALIAGIPRTRARV